MVPRPLQNLSQSHCLRTAALAVSLFGLAQVQAEEPVSFNEHIRPILAEHCVACHGGVKQASGVSFIYRDKALAEGESGMRSIVPGNVEESYLVDRIADPDPVYRMPPAEHGPALSAEEIELVKQWIREGAQWQEHWAFVAPERQQSPSVEQPQWVRMPLDAFVLADLEQTSLAPAEEASRSEWLRRVTFDLTGLPPTAEERKAFLSDSRPDAYERVVDRLLASPRYGERWAAMWLDLVRYSDTMGYEKDPHRDIWPYRDWLIRVLNDDLPYDQFIVKQLAGDLLPEATLGDRLATAMHRNTQTNTEGGTDDEEFRTMAVLDRVSTTWQVFAGLTFGCAQCHSHPYDPIENQEFYEFVAVMNNTRDADLDNETPRLAVPTDREQWAKANELDRQIRSSRMAIHQQFASLATDAENWQYLQFQNAESTGETKVEVIAASEDQPAEFVTRGTVTTGSMMTFDLAVPVSDQPITALRVDSLPSDVAKAIKDPETGFVVTRFRATIENPTTGESSSVSFQLAICDEPLPALDPAESLNDNNNGWGVEPRIYKPRWAVFVPREPFVVPEGSVLRVVLKHNRSLTGLIALVTNRGRFAVSTNPAWQQQLASPEYNQQASDLAQASRERQQIASVLVPVIEERLPAEQRPTYTFVRGNWLDRGDRVSPGVPAVFPPLDSEQPVDRLAVAHWLASTEHPLTARVMVNRLWQQLFGLGIVETVGDFGTSGLRPTHPELLDDLAVRFETDMQWSTKQLLREMVLSATYRQASQASESLAQQDPHNALLARGPRLRLTAEMVRDQALLLSGRMSDKMYGPSVMPPQPDGVWRSVYSGARWVTSEGDDRYRRAVYTYWKRTSPYPSMMMFDAPSREVCSVQRIPTNTPLQPLVTMNDPVFVECAQGFAERMSQQAAGSVPQQIAWGIEQATGEPATDAVVEVLLKLFEDSLEQYHADDEAHQALAPTAEAYARVIVASVILNLDDVITR
ncbi:PSD1 and planctomycete cytochrome C domain-containing protein [Aeoliella mucimassa]|uniref:Planctomycete cytochrome C n=1 Tax=Aeoliella mucimassa TaxID=2527972 RepID=A0A518AJ67_9BACT|nr:PSD1 and planctomycete cytochrome C domain-containing protein [Aeoliella mucimassa]QDU54756.1 Planctomycete cytochrome C [Aeoliella mucimassa]